MLLMAMHLRAVTAPIMTLHPLHPRLLKANLSKTYSTLKAWREAKLILRF
jgi:hypothetical protein